MSLEIRTEALKLAATLHTEVDVIVSSAEKFFAFLNGDIRAAVAGVEKVASEVKTAVSRKSKPEQTQPAAAPSSTATPAAPAASAPAASPEDVRKGCTASVIELVQKGARTAAEGILGKYGAKKVPELQPKDLSDALDDLKAELAKLAATKAA